MQSGGVGSLRAFLAEYLQGLADLQFNTIITTRMLPTIYVLGIGVSAVTTLALVFYGFQDSLVEGFVWLLLLGPVVFLAMVTAWRIILELCFAFFQLLLIVQDIAGQVGQVGDVAEQISTDLPRITFWRPLRRKGSRSGGKSAEESENKEQDE